MKMLRLTIPKGSLEEKTFQLFEKAGLTIKRKGERNYYLYIDDCRISEVFMLRSQETAKYVSLGEFDIGVSGEDWIIETRSKVKKIADLEFSKNGWKKVSLVLAANKDVPWWNTHEIKSNSRVVTEYPLITKKYFKSIGKEDVKINYSFGATEVKVPRLADYLVDIIDTGKTLAENGKKVLETILQSSTWLVANKESWKNPEKRKAIKEIAELLSGAVRARKEILLKANVFKDNLKDVLECLPTAKSPSVIPLFKKDWYGVETLVRKDNLNAIISNIKASGATDILEIDVEKYIP